MAINQITPVEDGRHYISQVAVSTEQALYAYKALQEITKKVLQPGTDYDTIPGTPKPSLLKPGAENLLRFYGLGHKMQVAEQVKEWKEGFFYFSYKCTVHKTLESGVEIVLSECEGSANSKESRYRDRWVSEKKLSDFNITSTAGLQFREKNGNWGPYREYKVENPDPFSIINTLQKMAQKRALVGATLQATGASGLFTQDVEDMDLTGTDSGTKEASGQPSSQNKGNQDPKKQTQSQGQGQMTGKISEPQQKAIFAIAKSKGLTVEDVAILIKGQYKASDVAELEKQSASEMIKMLQDTDKDSLSEIVQAYRSAEGVEIIEPSRHQERPERPF